MLTRIPATRILGPVLLVASLVGTVAAQSDPGAQARKDYVAKRIKESRMQKPASPNVKFSKAWIKFEGAYTQPSKPSTLPSAKWVADAWGRMGQGTLSKDDFYTLVWAERARREAAFWKVANTPADEKSRNLAVCWAIYDNTTKRSDHENWLVASRFLFETALERKDLTMGNQVDLKADLGSDRDLVSLLVANCLASQYRYGAQGKRAIEIAKPYVDHPVYGTRARAVILTARYSIFAETPTKEAAAAVDQAIAQVKTAKGVNPDLLAFAAQVKKDVTKGLADAAKRPSRG